MSPHRLTTMRRYKISNDVLIMILENLDPPSLWRACKAFRRIYSIVMEYQSLRYMFELAVSGMKNGPAAQSPGPPLARLQLLLTYRKDWPELHWTHEHKMQIPTPTHVGVSGGFFHRIRTHGFQHTLDLTELPSFRTGHPPALTRHLRYTTTLPIESVAIDPSQALIVTSHISSLNGLVGIQLHLRDLWTFSKHPQARHVSYDFSTRAAIRVSHVSILICGKKMVISLEFVGGRITHLLMDWRTFDIGWFDNQDLMFLDEDNLLVVKKILGMPVLSLYNIAHVASVYVTREYELPEAWGNASIGFCPNTSPRTDMAVSSDALFYPDPAARILVLTVKFPRHQNAGPGSSPRQWLFINESFFGPASCRERIKVSWNQWSQYCLLRALPPSINFIRGPYITGTRVLFLDSGSTHQSSRGLGPGNGTSDSPARLTVIEFSPFPDLSIPRSPAWTWIGQRTALVPNESERHLPLTTVDYRNVEGIRVTEDNIVLFLELRSGFRSVNILTFGFGTPSASGSMG